MGGIIDKVERQLNGKKKRIIKKLSPTHSEETVSIGNSSIDKEDIETLEAGCQTSTQGNSHIKIEINESNEGITSEPGDCKEHKIKHTKEEIRESGMTLSSSSENKYSVSSSRSDYHDENFIHEPPERDNDLVSRTENSESEFCFKEHLKSNTRPPSIQQERVDKISHQNHQRCRTRERYNINNRCRCCSDPFCKTFRNEAHNQRKETHFNPRLQEPDNSSFYRDDHPSLDRSENFCKCRNTTERHYEKPKRKDSDIFSNFSYQNSKQYKEIVEELGSSIAQKNKQRVQKALREFEMRSRENRNLDEPILYNDFDHYSGHSSYGCRSNCRCCCGSKRNPRSLDLIYQPPIFNNKIQNDKFTTTPIQNNFKFGGSICTKIHKQKCASHWELDPKTGTWYKVCNYLAPNKNRIGFCSSMENVLRRNRSRSKLESISSETRESFWFNNKTRPCSQQSTICNKCGSYFRRF